MCKEGQGVILKRKEEKKKTCNINFTPKGINTTQKQLDEANPIFYGWVSVAIRQSTGHS